MKEISQRHELWNEEDKRHELENKRLKERSCKLKLKLQMKTQREELEAEERVTEKGSKTEKEAQGREGGRVVNYTARKKMKNRKGKECKQEDIVVDN